MPDPNVRADGPVDIIIRAADIALAVLGLILSSPLVLFCLVVIPATSAGPAIFGQTRVGRDQRTFTCYKFRTMKVGTPSVASHEISVSAITPLGAILRRVKLDEIPQLWNVLAGEMSFVGPRPCLPSQGALILARQARGIYELIPGITGPAQIRGIDMSDPEHLAQADEAWRLDRSLCRYTQIIFLTIAGHGQGDRVRSA